MGRVEAGLKKGPWTAEEDEKLLSFIQKHGPKNWGDLPKLAGVNRCEKSCRARWINLLCPDTKRRTFSGEEELLILRLYAAIGDRWSIIAKRLPGRTENEIKNFWNIHLEKKLIQMTHQKFSRGGRTDKDEIKNSNSSSERKRFLSHLPIPGESQGNRTNFKSIKVDQGATPSFQETEETTPNSEVEGSQYSSCHLNTYPVPSQTTDMMSLNSTQASANNDAESDGSLPSGSSPFSDMLDFLDWQSSFGREGEPFANRIGEWKEFGSHLQIPGVLQGNMTNCKSIKVAREATPSFQETEETTPNSQSSSFRPNSYQVPLQLQTRQA